jgi:hypothetical protein
MAFLTCCSHLDLGPPVIYLLQEGGVSSLVSDLYCCIIHKSSSELLAKQAVRKKLLTIKTTYILKLLLSLVSAGIEALVMLRNNNLYPCLKEVCCL